MTGKDTKRPANEDEKSSSLSDHLNEAARASTSKATEHPGVPESTAQPPVSGPKASAMSVELEASDKLIGWLQMLLEAEHAGALIMVDSLKEARSEALIQQLESLHISEAASCQKLRRSLKRLGAIPSKKVSEFYAKTMIISDMQERLLFVARGQQWVAKRISEKLPTITQRWLHEELTAVLDLHT